MATVPAPMMNNMAGNEGGGMSMNDRMKMMMLPNGQIDMGMLLHAIEQRLVFPNLFILRECAHVGTDLANSSKLPEWSNRCNSAAPLKGREKCTSGRITPSLHFHLTVGKFPKMSTLASWRCSTCPSS